MVFSQLRNIVWLLLMTNPFIIILIIIGDDLIIISDSFIKVPAGRLYKLWIKKTRIARDGGWQSGFIWIVEQHSWGSKAGGGFGHPTIHEKSMVVC